MKSTQIRPGGPADSFAVILSTPVYLIVLYFLPYGNVLSDGLTAERGDHRGKGFSTMTAPVLKAPLRAPRALRVPRAPRAPRALKAPNVLLLLAACLLSSRSPYSSAAAASDSSSSFASSASSGAGHARAVAIDHIARALRKTVST